MVWEILYELAPSLVMAGVPTCMAGLSQMTLRLLTLYRVLGVLNILGYKCASHVQKGNLKKVKESIGKNRKNMYLYVEVIFYSGQRKHLPVSGYRPDAVFKGHQDYWGITFLDLPVERFDVLAPAIIKFSFQDTHYQEVVPGQFFAIMEGARQVGEGKIISIEE